MHIYQWFGDYYVLYIQTASRVAEQKGAERRESEGIVVSVPVMIAIMYRILLVKDRLWNNNKLGASASGEIFRFETLCLSLAALYIIYIFATVYKYMRSSQHAFCKVLD